MEVNPEDYCEYAQKIAMTLVKRYRIPSDAIDGLLSSAQLALVEAASRYDPSRKAAFKTYAFARIRGAVLDDIRAFARRNGYQQHDTTEAAHTDHTRSDYIISLQAVGDESDQAVLAGVLEYLYEGGMSVRGREGARAASGPSGLGIQSPRTPEHELLSKEDRTRLKEQIASLPEPDRFVVEQYYFQDHTMEEIGKQMGNRTKSWVSRIHSRAIKRLKDACYEVH